MKGLRAVGLCLAVSFLAVDADAAKVPISFAPTLGANAMRTQQKLAALEAKLPASFALPASLVTMKAGAIDLSFFPEMSAALTRAGTSATSPAMTWPAPSPALCIKHATFAVPASLLASGAGASAVCQTSESALRQKLAVATTRTCRDVEQPERYVLAAPPAVVDDTTTASIESFIALTGEALSHYPPQNGLLPADWVPTLRSVVWKLRRPALTKQLASARASYQQAIGVLTSQASCFEPAARAALAAAVNDLDGELMNAEGHLTKVETAGKATSDQELVCLAAHGRTRGALPFPALTAEERKFVAFWLGGITWRMRGGGLIPLGQTQKARTYFCEKPLRRIGDLAGGAKGEEAGHRVFLNIFDGWGDWMDMGTTPGGQDLYEDLVQMTDRGRQQVADAPSPVPGIPIPGLGLTSAVTYLDKENYDTTALTTGGLDMGACYAYALGALSDFRYADTPMAPYNGSLIEGFTAIGEFCTGASIALGLTETLLGGTTTGASTVPLCKSKQCGDDGCGGSCGACAAGTTCNPSGACIICTPSCAGKTCGDDGCGGSCGACGGPSGADAGSGGGAGAAPGAPGEDDATSAGCACHVTPARDGMLLLAPAAVALVMALLRRRRRS